MNGEAIIAGGGLDGLLKHGYPRSIMPLPLFTRRLLLAPFTADDGLDLLAVFGAPRVTRFWNSDPPADLHEAADWAAHLAAMQERLGYSQWRVSERDGGRLVGCAGLQPLDGGPEVELTYALAPGAWGRGYATEAARAILEFGFTEAGLDRIVGIARAGNPASLRVLQKTGMRRVGRASYFGSDWIKYALGRVEWLHGLPLVTERLELRLFESDDLEPLYEVFGDPRVMRYVGAEGRALDRIQLASSQRRVREHWRQHGFGPLALVELSSCRLVGEAGLQVLEGGTEVEVTYTLAHAAWGRGYATEAARAALRWGFRRLGFDHIVAVAYPQNQASLHVIDKLGMRPDGLQQCYGATLARFVLSTEEWRASLEQPPAAAPIIEA